MANVNEALFDSAVRHQVFLERYGGGTIKKILRLLDKADVDLLQSTCSGAQLYAS